jgi:leucyl/phenylalanyl-tRNA---protein transferase
MPRYLLPHSSDFPHAASADPEGLVAFGSNMQPETLLKAYKQGLFPWFSERGVIFWYSPQPRFVLFPEKIHISHSMRSLLKKDFFHFTHDTCFAEVIHKCRFANRKEESGSWIDDDFEKAYISLHEKGFAHSAETWLNGELVGGLYGVLIGKVFFGESMFSTVSNASKFAFIHWVEWLRAQNIRLIDCQVFSAHLQSLGAENIPRNLFLSLLKKLTVE